MARQCEICHKKQKITFKRKKLRSKYNPTAKKRQKPNLQWFKLPSGKKILICTKCRKLLTRKLY